MGGRGAGGGTKGGGGRAARARGAGGAAVARRPPAAARRPTATPRAAGGTRAGRIAQERVVQAELSRPIGGYGALGAQRNPAYQAVQDARGDAGRILRMSARFRRYQTSGNSSAARREVQGMQRTLARMSSTRDEMDRQGAGGYRHARSAARAIERIIVPARALVNYRG